MKEKYIKIAFFTIIILLLIISIYILYKDSAGYATNVEAQKLKINVYDDFTIGITNFDTINPLLTKSKDVQYITKLIYMPLIDITEDFRLTGGLAKEWSKVNDTSYLIKLKDDVYWHDGQKFTSDDILYTVNYLKQSEEESIYDNNIKNIESIHIIDEYTIKVNLYEKENFFEYMLTFPIISSKTKNFMIGTGDYKIDSMEADRINLKTEKEYHIKNINILIYKNVAKLYTDFSKEKIDFMITANTEFEEYIGTIGFRQILNKGREFSYIQINQNSKILSDVKIRQALKYAINRENIIYSIYNNKYIMAENPLDYGSYLSANTSNTKYDIASAKKALIQAGWKYENGKWEKENEFLRLRLLINRDEEKNAEVADLIKTQLEEFGITVEIIEASNYYYNQYTNYDLKLTQKTVSIKPEIDEYFDEENTQAKDLLNEIKNIDNEQVIEEKYEQILKIYNEEIPIIGLYFNSDIVAYSNRIKGNITGNWYSVFYNIKDWYKTDS